MDAFEVHFGYREQKKNIVITWEHLPFMQIFAKEHVDTKNTTVEVLTSLLSLGVPLEQANEFLGTEFEIKEPEQTPQNEQGQTQSGQEGAEEGDSGEAEASQGQGDNQEE
jgi:hypothetical protein